MIRGRDKTIEPHFLRLIYTSVVPLATMIQAPVRCWISAHCQRAPVTFGAKFNIGINLWL
ncbi:hypothetical protein BZG76_05350 [Salinivibrio sp. AR647]|nr:hypothetical protein BZG76_05350 [Salinivibrio sp. AR647]